MSPRRLSPLCFALVWALLAPGAAAGPPGLGRDAGYLDRLLARPYHQGTPFGPTGRCLWATSPWGWGFPNDVHYVQLDWLEPLALGLSWQGEVVEPGPAEAHVGHTSIAALPPGDLALNPAGSGLPRALGPGGSAVPALTDGDRGTGGAVWTAVPGPGGTVTITIELVAATEVASVVVSLAEDAGRGLTLPAAIAVQWLGPSGWTAAVARGTPRPPAPAAGPNFLPVAPVTTASLRVVLTAAATVGVAEVEAYPSGAAPLELVERKTITEDDTLVSVVEARNLGDVPAILRVEATSPLVAPDGSAPGALVGSLVTHRVPLSLRLELDAVPLQGGGFAGEQTVDPDGTAVVRAAMAFARSPAEAAAAVSLWLSAPDPIAARDLAIGQWFRDQVPQLDVPDPWFEKAWAYRFDLVRRTWTEPGFAPLVHPTFEEGRWTAPWFTRPITYGAPHQLRELRWLRDPAWVRGHVLTFVENARPDGAFVSVPLEGPASEYTDWIAAAIGEVVRATGDTDLAGRARAAMAANVAYVLASHDPDGDLLPVIADHYMTGMEWQPSFFYFDGFRTDRATPLERVDWAAGLFAGARATAEAAETLCDPAAAAAARATAEGVRAAVEARMWDPATSFYYSLRGDDDEKAWVREVVGFYPFAFDLADPLHDLALAKLFDPAEFWTAWPPASSSLTCPATSQDGWPIGPGGSQAMWNGPTWPHATSMAAEAAARVARRSAGIIGRDQIFELLASYTLAHFAGTGPSRNLAEPWLGEYYNGDTGAWKTGENSYFHSTYADLVVTILLGLEPSLAPEVRLDPLLPPGTWDRFLLERLPYHGHELTLAWDEPGGEDAYGDGRDGFELSIDGVLAAARPDLGPLSASLPEGRLLGVKTQGTGRPRFQREAAPPWSLYRSASRDLAGASPVLGSPFAGPAAVDPLPLPAAVVYYRSGACGHGR